MAVADVEAAPPQTPAPPARRSAAARAAWALSRFLSLASYVALSFLLCGTYMSGVANALRIAARWAGGEGSVWWAIAEYYFYTNIYALCLFAAVAFVFAMALLLHCFVMDELLLRRRRRREIAAGDSSGAKISLEHDQDQGAAGEGEEDDGRLDGGCALVAAIALLTSVVCMAAGTVMGKGIHAPPTRGSWEERLGSALMDAGFFLDSLTYSYVLFPTVVLPKVILGWQKVRKTNDLLTTLYLDG